MALRPTWLRLVVLAALCVAPGVRGDSFKMPPTGKGKGSTYTYDDDEPRKAYRRPNRDNYMCMKSLKEMYYRNIQDDDDLRCMGCDDAPTGTKLLCPSGCQGIINRLYANCDGITVPDGFYFDEARTIPDRWDYDKNKRIRGKWRSSVEEAITLEVRKCGCNAAGRLDPGLLFLLLGLLAAWWLSDGQAGAS